MHRAWILHNLLANGNNFCKTSFASVARTSEIKIMEQKMKKF